MPTRPSRLEWRLAQASVLAVIAFGVLACGSGGASPTPSGSNLEGTAWQLTGFVASDGSSVAPPAGVVVDMAFARATVSGSSGCNSYSGPYTVAGDRLQIGSLATTKKACPAPEAAVETRFLKALSIVGTYAVSGDTLTLSDTGGKPLLTLAASKPAALVGTTWSATQVNNGQEAVSSVVAGTTITAIFGSDGTVHGSGGCNTYSGTYVLAGRALTFGPLAATQKLCGTPAGVDAQESQFFAAMARVTTLEQTTSGIRLLSQGGTLEVAFSPDQ